VLVEEIVIAALGAEEQPVAPGRFARHAFVQEGAKRSDAAAGADHDDGHGRGGRQTEVLRLLDVDAALVPGAPALAHERPRDAAPTRARTLSGEGTAWTPSAIGWRSILGEHAMEESRGCNGSSASRKASGSGRTPENFLMAASTSSVAASPSGSSPAASAFAFCRRSPPVM